MFKITSKFTTSIALIAVLGSLILASCGSAATQTTTPASGQQSGNQPAQKPSSSSQQPSGQQPMGSTGQPPGNENMTSILKRAAEILGISSDKFTTAFQNASPKQSSSGQQGQPPTPPAGGQQGQPPTPSSDQLITQSQFMTEIYAKMATELGISADSIAKAMVQAEKELKK